MEAIVIDPIGTVRSPFRELADAPRQPPARRGVTGRIELVEGRHLEDAIADLRAWQHIWVLFWFHGARHYRPKVLPPRSGKRRGVLATRSPHRPNPIGMSVVRLDAIEGLVLHVRDLDMIDGTPVLDIKPYVPYADVVPDAGSGWLGADGSADPQAAWPIRWSEVAEDQLAFLAAAGVHLRQPVEQRLSLGPQPHAYRRIKVLGDRSRLAYKEWRLVFRVEGRAIEIEGVASGYRPAALASEGSAEIALHRRFEERFGDASGTMRT